MRDVSLSEKIAHAYRNCWSGVEIKKKEKKKTFGDTVEKLGKPGPRGRAREWT